MICIIDCHTSWIDKIKKNVTDLNRPCKVFKLDEVQNLNFESFSGIIISGSLIHITLADTQEYMKSFKFIKTVNIPVLGICLGHQMMGLLYGSEINRGKMINKMENIEIVKQDDLFLNIENHSLFQEEHSAFITLPPEFNLLAKSATCDNESMKHKNKKLYGVQFHPEVSGNNGKILFKNFLNCCENKSEK